MGADYYETPEQRAENLERGIPNLGIGAGTRIARAIIDKDARIGSDCRLGVGEVFPADGDYDGYFVREGIIIVPKKATIPSGTVI